MDIKVLGHATVMITNSKTIYTDPYKGDFSKKADIILVSHSHYDHLDIKRINEIKTDNTKIFTTKEASSKIIGAISMNPGDKQVIGDITIKAVHAYNVDKFRSPGIPFHPKGFGIGFIITMEGKRVYFAGDTDFIPEMKTFENIDYALLPISGTYVMDIDEAIQAAKAINANIVIPMHEFKANKQDFASKAKEQGITVELS